MRDYLRLLRVILAALLRNPRDFTGESVLDFTVMPWDCVVKLVGNDRYHTFMDLGRIDLLIRMGGWHTLLHERLQPFVQSVHVRYRYPLHLFQGFILRSRLVHSDHSYFWTEHIFQVDDKIMATAVSKNGLTRCNRIVSTDKILQFLVGNIASYAEERILTVNAVEKLLRNIR